MRLVPLAFMRKSPEELCLGDIESNIILVASTLLR
jgi:hypothetical protein